MKFSNKKKSFSFTFVGDNRFRFNPQTVQRVGDVQELLAERLINDITGDVAISRLAAKRVGDTDRTRRRDGDAPRERSLSSFCKISTSFLYISRSSSIFFTCVSSRAENESFLDNEPPDADGVGALVVRRHFCNSCNKSFS